MLLQAAVFSACVNVFLQTVLVHCVVYCTIVRSAVLH